jgi:hypothetical protein
MPRARMMRRWKRLHGSRSSREGIAVLITPWPLIKSALKVLTANTLPPASIEIAQCL